MNGTGPVFLGLDRADPRADPGRARVVVLPLPYGGTVTWGKGAQDGPGAILEASRQVELWDEVLRCEPVDMGIATQAAPPMPDAPAAAVETAYRAVREVLEKGQRPVCLGGEHSLTAGTVRAVLEHDPGAGVVQLDAHADLRDTYEGSPHNHACTMARVREQTAAVLQLGVRSLSRDEHARIEGESLGVVRMHELRAATFDLAAALAPLPPRVFVTLDVDVIDPCLVRSTGTPEPGGAGWEEINNWLACIFREKDVVGFDVMELCGGDPVSSFTAARLAYRMMGLWGVGGCAAPALQPPPG
jgi:agmatinase